MTRQGAPHRTRGGFTLPELLVVITILVILAAMLAPALNGFVERAHTLQCQSNLKQIATALLNYSAANSNIIMPCRVRISRDGYKYNWDERPYWCTMLIEYDYIDAPNVHGLPDRSTTVETGNVFRCPSGVSIFYDWHTGINPAVQELRGYVRYFHPDDLAVDAWYHYNGHTFFKRCPGAAYPPGHKPMPQTREGRLAAHQYLGEIKDRSTMVMVCDGVALNGISYNTRISSRHWGDVGIWDGVATHRTLTNMAYYDGHVEGYQWPRDYRDSPLWDSGLWNDRKPFFQLGHQ